MAKLIFGMMPSLDGYVDDLAGGLVIPPPDPVLFAHFSAQVAGESAVLYGRRIYELMRYWDDEQPDWDEAERAFARAWRGTPKWVFSRTLTAVGNNAALVSGDVEAAVRKLKSEIAGEIEVAGPDLAGSLTRLGLIDEYRLYLRPFVLGGGKPFFAGARPPLRLTGTQKIGADTIMLTYVPA